MTVGVTGGTGFIGQYLIRDYGKEYDFIVPIRGRKKIPKKAVNAEYIESDYSIDSLKKLFSHCDSVIHLAAKKTMSSKDLLNIPEYMDNISITTNVFQACNEVGVKNIINVSSMGVYGDVMYATEDMVCKPYSCYAVLKVCAENIADYYNRTSGMNIKSFRLAEVVGWDFNKQNMLKEFWNVCLKNSLNQIPVPVWGKGITGSDKIYVKDVTRALIIGLDEQIKGIYNIGSGKVCKNVELANAFCKVFENKSGITFYSRYEERGTQSCLNCEKAKNEFGFEAEYDLEEMIYDVKTESI